MRSADDAPAKHGGEDDPVGHRHGHGMPDADTGRARWRNALRSRLVLPLPPRGDLLLGAVSWRSAWPWRWLPTTAPPR